MLKTLRVQGVVRATRESEYIDCVASRKRTRVSGREYESGIEMFFFVHYLQMVVDVRVGLKLLPVGAVGSIWS